MICWRISRCLNDSLHIRHAVHRSMPRIIRHSHKGNAGSDDKNKSQEPRKPKGAFKKDQNSVKITSIEAQKVVFPNSYSEKLRKSFVDTRQRHTKAANKNKSCLSQEKNESIKNKTCDILLEAQSKDAQSNCTNNIEADNYEPYIFVTSLNKVSNNANDIDFQPNKIESAKSFQSQAMEESSGKTADQPIQESSSVSSQSIAALFGNLSARAKQLESLNTNSCNKNVKQTKIHDYILKSNRKDKQHPPIGSIAEKETMKEFVSSANNSQSKGSIATFFVKGSKITSGKADYTSKLDSESPNVVNLLKSYNFLNQSDVAKINLGDQVSKDLIQKDATKIGQNRLDEDPIASLDDEIPKNTTSKAEDITSNCDRPSEESFHLKKMHNPFKNQNVIKSKHVDSKIQDLDKIETSQHSSLKSRVRSGSENPHSAKSTTVIENYRKSNEKDYFYGDKEQVTNKSATIESAKVVVKFPNISPESVIQSRLKAALREPKAKKIKPIKKYKIESLRIRDCRVSASSAVPIVVVPSPKDLSSDVKFLQIKFENEVKSVKLKAVSKSLSKFCRYASDQDISTDKNQPLLQNSVTDKCAKGVPAENSKAPAKRKADVKYVESYFHEHATAAYSLRNLVMKDCKLIDDHLASSVNNSLGSQPVFENKKLKDLEPKMSNSFDISNEVDSKKVESKDKVQSITQPGCETQRKVNYSNGENNPDRSDPSVPNVKTDESIQATQNPELNCTDRLVIKMSQINTEINSNYPDGKKKYSGSNATQNFNPVNVIFEPKLNSYINDHNSKLESSNQVHFETDLTPGDLYNSKSEGEVQENYKNLEDLNLDSVKSTPKLASEQKLNGLQNHQNFEPKIPLPKKSNMGTKVVVKKYNKSLKPKAKITLSQYLYQFLIGKRNNDENNTKSFTTSAAFSSRLISDDWDKFNRPKVVINIEKGSKKFESETFISPEVYARGLGADTIRNSRKRKYKNNQEKNQK